MKSYMADEYSMTIKGLPELQRSFKRIGTGVKNTHNSLDDAGEHLVKFYSGDVFASRGGAIGEKWPSLNADYARAKAQRWPGRPPLIRTGRMQRSFKYDINPARLRIKNIVDYFKYHQSGQARSGVASRKLKGAHVADLDINYFADQGYTSLEQKGKNVTLGGSGLPRRQIMKLTTTLRRDVRQIINKQLTRELRKV